MHKKFIGVLSAAIALVSFTSGAFAQVTCPANMTLNTEPGLCGAVANFSATVTSTATPVITYSQQPGTLFARGTTPVTVTASGAGGSFNCTFNVTVKDVTLPTITAPSNASYQCPSNVPPSSPLDAFANDNCGVNITINETRTGAGTAANPLLITRTYTATDPDGNSASAAQTITVTDALPPAITAPPSASYVCPSEVPPASPANATASDNCGPATVTVNETKTGAGTAASPLLITRTYTATDQAGNTTQAAQTITVADSVNPTVTAPPAATYACPSEVPPASPSNATAGDNCGQPTVTVNETKTGAGTAASPLLITRTYTATDQAGNTAQAAQTITVTDNVNPTLTAPPAASYACTSEVPPASPANATAGDNCGQPTVTVNETKTGAGTAASPLLITRTYTATDQAGNTAQTAQTITVTDNVNPTLILPQQTAYQCQSEVPPASASGATASDNCGQATVTVTETSNQGAGTVLRPLIYNRTYTATDAAGNKTTASQKITVIDNTPPVLSGVPETVSGIACMSLGDPVVTDNCGGPTHVVNTAPKWLPMGSFPVAWIYSDNHGNIKTLIQKVTVTGYGPASTFAPPLGTSPLQVKKGSSVPVKFSLLQCPDYPLAIANISVDGARTTSTQFPHLSNAFRYSSGQYAYSLSVNQSYTVGDTYNITASLKDGQAIQGSIVVTK